MHEDRSKFILDKYYDRFERLYANRNYAYAMHELDLATSGVVHNILDHKARPRFRTLCKHMQVMGLVFGFRNILTDRIDLVSNDADEILRFMNKVRLSRFNRSAFESACYCARRDNVILDTFVKAFSELGFTIQIGEKPNESGKGRR